MVMIDRTPICAITGAWRFESKVRKWVFGLHRTSSLPSLPHSGCQLVAHTPFSITQRWSCAHYGPRHECKGLCVRCCWLFSCRLKSNHCGSVDRVFKLYRHNCQYIMVLEILDHASDWVGGDSRRQDRRVGDSPHAAASQVSRVWIPHEWTWVNCNGALYVLALFLYVSHCRTIYMTSSQKEWTLLQNYIAVFETRRSYQ